MKLASSSIGSVDTFAPQKMPDSDLESITSATPGMTT